MGAAYVRFAVANPSHYRVMFGGVVDPEAPDPELAAEAEGAFQALVDALAALQRDGSFHRDDAVLMARYSGRSCMAWPCSASTANCPSPAGSRS